MTVSAPATLVYSAAGNGVTTVFPYTLAPFYATGELVVVISTTAGETVKVLGTHYTVSGGNGSTGSVTFLTAPAVGETVYIYRNTAETQTVDLEDDQRNPADATEKQLDRMVMMIQDHGVDLYRAVKVRLGDTPQKLPSPSAGQFIAWDDAGESLINADPTTRRQILVFETRSDAQAYNVADDTFLLQVKFSGRLYSYTRDLTATSSTAALITADGAFWRPADTPNFAHWGYSSVGSFDPAKVMGWMEANGGGTILLDEIITLSATLELPSKVIIQGRGPFVSGFKAAAGLNNDLVRTKDFATLTGSNKWLVSEGVPYGFGLRDLSLDGNNANNTAGMGWKVYGKGYVFDNLIIFKTAKEGWYSECSYAGGQETHADVPEGDGGSMVVWSPGNRGSDLSNGIEFRGPHDMRIKSLGIANSDGDGALFITDGATYNGKCDVAFIHAYGCYGKGIRWEAGGSATHLIGESCDKEGVYISGFDAQIGMIEAYRNCIRSVSTGREYNVYATGAGHMVTAIETRDSNNNEGGFNNSASRSQFTSVHCSGQGTSEKTGIKNTGQMCTIAGNVSGFSLAGGRALDLSGEFNNYDFTVYDCATAIYISAADVGVDAKIRANLLTGQVLFAGTEPVTGSALNKETSSWDVSARINTTYVTTRQRKKTGSSFDATAAVGTEAVMTMGHNLPFAPDPEDISCSVVFDDGAGGIPAGTPFAIASVYGTPTTSLITFRYRILDSGAGTDRGFIVANIRY